MTFKTDLESEVKKIFVSPWTVIEAKAVPTFKDLSPDNDAKKLRNRQKIKLSIEPVRGKSV